MFQALEMMIGSEKTKICIMESLNVRRLSWRLVENGDEIKEDETRNREISFSLFFHANSFEHSKY